MSQYEGIESFELQDLYRALDELDNYQEAISKHLFEKQKKYCGEVDVVFFDVTTLYFESQKMDDLRKFGYSKDCKFNEVQIVLSMLVNAEGVPFAYELFPGNVYEGHTLVSCLTALKEKYAIKKVILVADRGIYSADNLEAARKAGFEYIVGATVRKAPREIQAQVFSQEGYRAIHDEKGNLLLKHKTLQITHKPKKNKPSPIPETIVCVYSPKRALKDRHDRERLIQKAFEMVESGQTPPKKGAQKYLKIVQTTPRLDETKIATDTLWDGFYAISSNAHLTEQAIIQAFSTLWTIEQSFRTLKSHFEARPLFHWTPKRIAGHILLNFIALIFENFIETALKKRGCAVSPQKIRDALSSMQKSFVPINDSMVQVYSSLEPLQLAILSLFSIQLSF
jgi:transposase